MRLSSVGYFFLLVSFRNHRLSQFAVGRASWRGWKDKGGKRYHICTDVNRRLSPPSAAMGIGPLCERARTGPLCEGKWASSILPACLPPVRLGVRLRDQIGLVP